jgi:hypothetical protein
VSWNFRKAGTIKDALKASVQAEHAPQAIKDEVCARIDDLTIGDHQAIYAASHGYMMATDARPWKGVDEIKITVTLIPLIDTPL